MIGGATNGRLKGVPAGVHNGKTNGTHGIHNGSANGKTNGAHALRNGAANGTYETHNGNTHGSNGSHHPPDGGPDLGDSIAALLEDGIRVQQATAATQSDVLADIARLWIRALAGGHKILLFGNGGSAADAQHIAGELVSRFLRDRQALAAVALTTDSSILTAIGNDYGFERVFARQVEALGRPGDVAVGITTSGRSPNVVAALDAARAGGLAAIAFTGADGGAVVRRVDVCFRVASNHTPRIQEAHIAAAHALCEVVERALAAPSERVVYGAAPASVG